MAFVRQALFAVAFAVGSSASASDSPQRLVAVADCPSGGQAGGCLEMQMHWDYARTDRAPFVSKPAAESAGKVVRVLTVRGRLGKGRVRFFELAVSSSGRLRKDDIGEVAYLGRSREGRPMIATDRGTFAVETRGLHVGRADGVVIIDERKAKIVRSYLGGLDGGAYALGGPDAIGALGRSGACLSPPESRPGTLAAGSACGDDRPPPDGLEFSERLKGAIAAAPDADLAMIRKLLPQTGEFSDAQLRAKIGRIGDHHLVVTPWAEAK